MFTDLSASATITSSAETLRELLSEHDATFVRRAYITLLGRPVDPDGFNHYLGQLRQGIKKIMILDALSRSSEARAFGRNLPGLRKAIALHRLSRIPVVGAVVRSVKGLDGDKVADRRLRSIENQIFALSIYAAERFQILESSIAQLDLADGRSSSGTRRMSPVSDAEPPLGEDFTPRMRDIYRILKASSSARLAV